MNVAIAVKEFPPDVVGGTETQTDRMARALAERGHQVTVYTKHYGDHDDTGRPYEVVRCRNLRWTPMISDLTFLLVATLALVRRADRHDCLQCMMVWPMGFLGYVVHRLTGLPYFAWVRGNDFYVAKDVRFKRWTIRRVLEDALVLVQSDEIEGDVRAEFPDLDPELEVLGNGVTIPDDVAALEGQTILYLGRLAPKKGVEYLVRAMAEVDVAGAELEIVGDGPERARLEALADDLGVEARFEGLVEPDQVDEFYRTASVFVLPSTEGEGLPNAVLEAMAWGLPVIATDSGGIPSLIDNGRNGYLVPMRAPEDLAQRIEQLLTDPQHRRSVGRAARSTVRERHEWPYIINEVEGIYRRVRRR